MKFYAISTFRNSLKRLCDNTGDGYSSCPTDIYKEFTKYDFDSMWQRLPKLVDNGNVRIIKLKVGNSGRQESKANGFRVVHLLIKKTNKIIFLDVFPKRGKYKKLTITESELEKYFETFNYESDSLIEIEFKANDIIFIQEPLLVEHSGIAIPQELLEAINASNVVGKKQKVSEEEEE